MTTLSAKADAVQFLGECLEDRRKLIEAFFHIQTRNAEGLVPLEFNAVQRDYWTYVDEPHIIALKARQVTYSTIVQADFTAEAMLTPGLNCLILVQKPENKAVKPHMDRVKGFYYSTPQQFRPPLENENETQLVFRHQWGKGKKELSHIYFATAGSTEIGRGETIHRVHRTEIGSWTDEELDSISEMMLGLPKTARVRDEGTPRRHGGPLYRMWQNAKRGNGSAKPKLYPWWWCEDYRIDDPALLTDFEPTETEARLMLMEKLEPERILWRRAQINRAASQWGDQAEAHVLQEYLENDISCFRLAGQPVLNAAYLEILLAEAKPPVKTDWDGDLRIWLPPADGEQYVIGADPAQGLAHGHDSAATIRKVRTWEHCGSLLGKLDTETFAGRLVELSKLYNNALISPERNNHGHALIANLVHLGCNRIYRHYAVIYRNGDDQLGVPISGGQLGTKTELITDLVSSVNHRLFHTWDSQLINQLFQLQEEPIATAGGDQQGKYDTSELDMVSAELVAIQGKGQATDLSYQRAPSVAYGLGRLQ
jgi:hypothetical protein